MNLFDSKLKALRAEANLTQEQLADEVGVVRQTIAYIEGGEYMPSLGLAYKIAKRFNKKIEEIFVFNN